MRHDYAHVLTKPGRGPALLLALAGMCAGCIDDDEQSRAGTATCGAADAYSPYSAGTFAAGDVAELPWGEETFDSFADAATIECASAKAKLSHFDVTAGCLTAATLGNGEYHRARVELTAASHGLRVVALGHADGDVVKWFAQRSEYRFYYSGETYGVNPGFKIFARYRSEDDLYVGSWRLDGVVQIQKKQCGTYTTLARAIALTPPTPRVWHRIRFDAIDEQLTLYLDDKAVLSTTSATFSWGTVGIRVDGTTGAYLDDWRVF